MEKDSEWKPQSFEGKGVGGEYAAKTLDNSNLYGNREVPRENIESIKEKGDDQTEKPVERTSQI